MKKVQVKKKREKIMYGCPYETAPPLGVNDNKVLVQALLDNENYEEDAYLRV